jgi:hypothetical protein
MRAPHLAAPSRTGARRTETHGIAFRLHHMTCTIREMLALVALRPRFPRVPSKV